MREKGSKEDLIPSVRDLRRKVKSVKSTQQITKAMKMVAAARLQRAQGRILAARPFAVKLRSLMADLCAQMAAQGVTAPHPLLAGSARPAGRVGLVVVSADKGLCGSFNTNVLRKAAEFLSHHPKTAVYPVGRKARDLFRGMGLDVRREYAGIFGRLGFVHAELIGKDLMEDYENAPLESVSVIYNEFKSLVRQKVVVEKLLPIDAAGLASGAAPGPAGVWATDYLYEPPQTFLLGALVPRFVKAQVFRFLLESAAAELAARMTAMDSATRNAGELIDSLTLTMNKVRQAGITKEISELVAGAEALK